MPQPTRGRRPRGDSDMQYVMQYMLAYQNTLRFISVAIRPRSALSSSRIAWTISPNHFTTVPRDAPIIGG